MGVVNFDPSCFIDEIYAATMDPLHKEFEIIELDKLDRVQMYVILQQLLINETNVFAYALNENCYIISEDDLYSVVDNMTDVIIDFLGLSEGEFDSAILHSDLTDDPNIDAFIEDEYEAFQNSGDRGGFTEADDLRGIVMQILSEGMRASIKRLTGKTKDVETNYVEID